MSSMHVIFLCSCWNINHSAEPQTARHNSKSAHRRACNSGLSVDLLGDPQKGLLPRRLLGGQPDVSAWDHGHIEETYNSWTCSKHLLQETALCCWLLMDGLKELRPADQVEDIYCNTIIQAGTPDNEAPGQAGVVGKQDSKDLQLWALFQVHSPTCFYVRKLQWKQTKMKLLNDPNSEMQYNILYCSSYNWPCLSLITFNS